jgi:hypothetical protein
MILLKIAEPHAQSFSFVPKELIKKRRAGYKPGSVPLWGGDYVSGIFVAKYL